MTAILAQIWRHPIKGVGREPVSAATLTAGACLPWDRTWAIAHEAARLTEGAWSPCRNFLRAAGSPRLMAVTCQLDEATEQVTLRHPDQSEITLHPETDAEALHAWLAPLVPEGRPAPKATIRIPGRGMTDSGTPGVTIGNLASHRAVEGRLGRPLSLDRWRCNLWLDGLAPWEEFDWVDQEIQIGGARLQVYGRTERCRATEANPETGQRDTDTLGLLRGWDHQDFTIKAKVISSGDIALGDVAGLA